MVGGITIFFLLLFFLLQLSGIQQFIVRSVTNDLSSRVQSEIRVGEIDYKFFNTITLKDVYVEDLQQDTLIFVEEIDAHFRFFNLFKGKITFYSLDIDGLYGNIYIDEQGENNLQFLITAFTPKEKKAGSQIEYSFQRVYISNSSLQYIDARKPVAGSPDKLDPAYMYFNDIRAELALNVLNADTVNGKILNFSANEKSGLSIRNFTTEFSGSTTGLHVPYVMLELPQSKLLVKDIELQYDSIADFQDFAEKVHFSAALDGSYITLNDLAPLAPALKGMEVLVSLEILLEGKLSNLRMPRIKMQYGESFVFNGDLSLNGLPDLKQTFMYGNISELSLYNNDLERFLSDLMNEPFYLPPEMKRLGKINYRGNVSGFFSNMVLYGNLFSDIGRISTDLLLQFENDFKDVYYNGTVKSSGLDLGKVIEKEGFGNIAFYFNTTGLRKMNSSFQGTIDANVPELYLNGYTYRDIRFDGKYDGTGFNGSLVVEDENINARFNGLIDLTTQIPVFDFELRVKDTNLHALNLTEGYEGALLSFNGKTNMTGNSLDNINGYVRFDSISFINKGERLDVDEIQFISRTEKNYTNFVIESNYVNGSISGNFNYSYILQLYPQLLNEFLPSFEEREAKDKISNRLDIDFTIENLDDLTQILELPFSLSEKSTITGYSDEQEDIIDIVVNVPKFSYNDRNFNNVRVYIWAKNQKIELIVETDIPTVNDFWNFSLYTAARQDTISFNMEWRNKQKVVNRGEFKSFTEFYRDENNNLLSRINILPTEVILSDQLWQVAASTIDFNADNSFQVHDFRFGNAEQFINIDGIASKSQQDTLSVEMKEVNLAFVSTLANMKGFRLGGEATGNIQLLSLLDQPVFDAILSVDSLQFNEQPVGDAAVFATWDQLNEQIVAIASIDKDDHNLALGECTFDFKEKRLDIDIDLDHISINFLTPYFDKVLPNTQGYASGHLYIGGPLNAIRFDGRLKMDEGQITVGVLGATYSINDSIFLSPYAIEFPKVSAYDAENNKVTVDGALRHNGSFRNFIYDLTVTTPHAQVMDLRAGENDLMFGKAYAEARVRITGNEEVVNIRVNGITRPGSKVYIQVATSSTATDAGFIQFVDHTVPDEDIIAPIKKAIRKSSNTKLDLQIEVTPDAEVGLIIDPVGGDMISGKGQGNIRVEYDDSQAEAKMYGSYVLESGSYTFTLDVFRKIFRIESGSSISWAGSPSNAQVNIRAIYSLRASLKDLFDPTTLATFARQTTIPVNCVLILTDNLTTPTINFDIELPSSDEIVKQHVKSVINTEEMLTRQILYLLVFNKFYTPENLRAEDGVGSNDFLSLATSTVSSQINRIFSQMSNKVSIGFDAQWGDYDREVVGEIVYQPNDRWIVNGNFGYRNDLLSSSNDDSNRFITDFDVEYLLTPNTGKLRLKFYNHTIDRKQLKTARNTQGIGLAYKEDFDTVGDLFRYYWSKITGIGKKNKNKENEETENADEKK